ncbi:hypothetical protein LQ564_22280 [Massilia sp. G4R7]|uniref:Uncharacterized protein n=1 Tax=Massilia phyllostachyos TaxID=2898585 RepID=A0ABS8QBX2_9BURK|nr:hypothetical protein [Massilia phyllostachyos]MCD2519033.1 hypothetical protein [Massilia phyllostachyos]
MKLRLASPHFAERFHGPMRFGRRWRGHELALRLIQMAVLIVVGLIAARLIAGGVTLGARAIANMFGA